MAENTKPVQDSIRGEIVAIKAIKKGDYVKKDGTPKFKHDTSVISVDPLDGNPVKQIFITEDQKRAYAIASSLFVGNIVTVNIEHCIEGETTYYDNDEDMEKYHGATYDAFVGLFPVSKVGLIQVFMKQGIPAELVNEFIKEVTTAREKYLAQIPKPIEALKDTTADVVTDVLPAGNADAAADAAEA